MGKGYSKMSNDLLISELKAKYEHLANRDMIEFQDIVIEINVYNSEERYKND